MDENEPITTPLVVNAKGACKLLAISQTTLHKLINRDDRFPSGAKIGRSRRWLVADLVAYLRDASPRPRRRKGAV